MRRPRPAHIPRPDARRSAASHERGQVVPLVAAMVVVTGLLLAGLVRIGVAVVHEARAQSAADAAALAGARRGDEVARALARDNGARLTRFTRVGGDVVVEVRLGGATAIARARPER